MKKKIPAKMIKRGIDSYPGGICFFSLDGRVILVNEKMNRLMLELTGHTLLNASGIWDELASLSDKNSVKKLEQSWLPKEPGSGDARVRQMFFRISDGSVWRFERRVLDADTMQLEAAEITEFYRLSEELYENTLRLREMQKRQEDLLDSIVEVNLSREILAAKMQIHDELGHCLLATTRAAAEGSLAENTGTLRENWRNTIRDFPTSLRCGQSPASPCNPN